MKPYKNEETLRRLYWEEELSLNQISGRLDCSLRTVYRYFLKYEIPRREISDAVKNAYDYGHSPWNRGLTKDDPRVRKYCFNPGNFEKGEYEKRECVGCGEEFSVLVTSNRKYCSRECYLKNGHPWNKGLTKEKDERVQKLAEKLEGREFSEEHKERISKKARERFSNPENHPCWDGGKSFEPYSAVFNQDLKREVRKRDNYSCQACGVTEETLNQDLDIHHIDFNKSNNSLNNLVSLCRSCHLKLHWERDWN